jgi:hypothetical protein
MQIGRGRCKCRGGKLADRFLFANCDLAAINKKTLVATPYTFSPSYAQAVSAGMATAGADGVGSGENGTEGAGIGGRGYGATAADTATTMAQTTMAPASAQTLGLTCQTTAPVGSTIGDVEDGTAAAAVHEDGMEGFDRAATFNATTNNGYHHKARFSSIKTLRCRINS